MLPGGLTVAADVEVNPTYAQQYHFSVRDQRILMHESEKSAQHGQESEAKAYSNESIGVPEHSQ